MLYLKYTPIGPLSALVEYLWLLMDSPTHAREHILPTGTLELVISLHEGGICVYDESGSGLCLPGLVVSGVFTRPLVVDTATHALVMGAHFRPGGASPFLHIAPGELCGHGDVLRVARPGELREQLVAAPSHEERFRILEQHLLPYAVAPDPLVQYAVDRFVRGGTPVRAVVAELGVSHRHFTSRFRQLVGTTPKVFARIQRFQHTLTRVNRAPDWAQLALTCGYSDQAHLIREFSSLAGCTPREYLRGRSPLLKDHHLMTRSTLSNPP